LYRKNELFIKFDLLFSLVLKQIKINLSKSFIWVFCALINHRVTFTFEFILLIIYFVFIILLMRLLYLFRSFRMIRLCRLLLMEYFNLFKYSLLLLKRLFFLFGVRLVLFNFHFYVKVLIWVCGGLFIESRYPLFRLNFWEGYSLMTLFAMKSI
jgi:hypothetical protein